MLLLCNNSAKLTGVDVKLPDHDAKLPGNDVKLAGNDVKLLEQMEQDDIYNYF